MTALDGTITPDADIRSIQKQVDGLVCTVREGFDELKKYFSNIEERTRRLENNESASKVSIDLKIAEIEKDISCHDKDIKEMRNILHGVQSINKILTWILGVLTVVGTALIIFLLEALLSRGGL